MAEKRNGLLLVLMQPPAALEEDFTKWYQTEHLPERAAVPGFLTALRYVCLTGYPRFCAIYDLDSIKALDSKEYLAVSGDRFSPWTKYITNRVQVYRVTAGQIYPGTAVTRRSSRVLLVRLRDLAARDRAAVTKAARATFEALPQTTGLRVFAARAGSGMDYFCWVEMTPPPAAPIDLMALGPFARHVDIVNLYTPLDVAA